MATIFRSDIPMDAPPAGTPRSAGKALYRASFNLSNRDTLIGEATGTGDGLKVATWVGTDKALAIVNNEVVRGTATGTWFNGLPLQGDGASISIYIKQLATAGDLYLDLFRASLTGSPNGYRLVFNPGGTAQLGYRLDGVNKYVGAAFSYHAEARLEMRWVGGLLEALLDNVVVSQVAANFVAPTGYAGITGVTASAGFVFDQLYVDEY